MVKTKVGIIGSGNIGTDLMIKIMRLSDVLEMAAFVGIEALRMPTRGPLGFFTGPGQVVTSWSVLTGAVRARVKIGSDPRGMLVHPDGTFYQRVTALEVPKLVEEHFIKGRPYAKLLPKEEVTGNIVATQRDFGFFAKQEKIILENCGIIDAEKIDETALGTPRIVGGRGAHAGTLAFDFPDGGVVDGTGAGAALVGERRLPRAPDAPPPRRSAPGLPGGAGTGAVRRDPPLARAVGHGPGAARGGGARRRPAPSHGRGRAARVRPRRPAAPGSQRRDLRARRRARAAGGPARLPRRRGLADAPGGGMIADRQRAVVHDLRIVRHLSPPRHHGMRHVLGLKPRPAPQPTAAPAQPTTAPAPELFQPVKPVEVVSPIETKLTSQFASAKPEPVSGSPAPDEPASTASRLLEAKRKARERQGRKDS